MNVHDSHGKLVGVCHDLIQSDASRIAGVPDKPPNWLHVPVSAPDKAYRSESYRLGSFRVIPQEGSEGAVRVATVHLAHGQSPTFLPGYVAFADNFGTVQ